MRRTTRPTKIEDPPVIEAVEVQETPSKSTKSLRSRHGLYNEGFVTRMFEISQLGLTQAQIAIAFGVSVKTIELWVRKYPAFRDAYDRGKDIHDHAVQTSLLRRALGYEYKEEKEVQGKDSIGRPYSFKTTTVKHVVADTTAMIFWLKNRHKEEWADVKQTQHSGNIGMGAKDVLKLSTLSPDDLAMVKRIAIAQLADQ